jgi:ADP-ribose pyrophosphatase
MGWIEDPYGAVLLVKQVRGRKLWTLPGGKIAPTERVDTGLEREIFEETGVRASVVAQIALFDRPQKRNITFLFRAALRSNKKFSPPAREIAAVEYRTCLPRNASPSLRHFWQLLRGSDSARRSEA